MSPRTLADLIDLSGDDDPSPEGSNPGTLAPGDQIHFYATATLLTHESPSGLGGGAIVERGQTVTLTQTILDLSKDRNGDSWLDLVDDVPVQVEKYGQRLFGRGPFPEGEPRYLPGSAEETDERNRRHEAAKHMPEGEAKVERARIREELGTGGGTTTLGQLYGGGPA